MHFLPLSAENNCSNQCLHWLLQHADGMLLCYGFESALHKKKRSPPFWVDFAFSGCGRRTRTSGLRVMSPTSFQLLYPAILNALPEC